MDAVETDNEDLNKTNKQKNNCQTTGQGEGGQAGGQKQLSYNSDTKTSKDRKCTAGWLQNKLTVREVKVMHMPPKPLKVRAMKIRTESSANIKNVTSLLTTKLTVSSKVQE